MSSLSCLCLLAYSSVHHILCCVFFYFVCFRLGYSMLPISIGCPLLISSLVFSIVYLGPVGNMP